MQSVVESLPGDARVLIVRLRSLGDCVLTTPAVRLLKDFRPDLQIAIAVEDRFVPLFVNNPDLTAILPPSKRQAFGYHPHLTIDFHGGSRSALLTALSLAHRRAGFRHFRHRWAYNLAIPRAQQILRVERKVHTAEHLASAMFWLGVPRAEIPRAKLFAPPMINSQPYAVIHPCASAPAKTWPPDRFGALALALDSEGLQPVFIGGSGDDLSPFLGFRHHIGAPLRQVMSLIAGAALFIGNDSGPAHIAAAFGRPAVVLFGSSDPAIWAPWRTDSEIVVAPRGLADVSVEQVFLAVKRLLERHR